MASLARLVRIAQRPQDKGEEGQAKDLGVYTIEKGQSAMLLGLIERNALLEIGAGGGQLSQIMTGLPQRPVGD